MNHAFLSVVVVSIGLTMTAPGAERTLPFAKIVKVYRGGDNEEQFTINAQGEILGE